MGRRLRLRDRCAAVQAPATASDNAPVRDAAAVGSAMLQHRSDIREDLVNDWVGVAIAGRCC